MESEDDDAEDDDEAIDWEEDDEDKRMPKQAHVPGAKAHKKSNYMKCGDARSNNECLRSNSTWRKCRTCTCKGGPGKLQKSFGVDGRPKELSLTTGGIGLCVRGRQKARCAQGCGKPRQTETPQQTNEKGRTQASERNGP